MPHRDDFLNDQQVAVLRWVSDGADVRAYPEGDYAHRISARGLANRGLIVITGRGATWSAKVTSEGQQRLADLPQTPPPSVSADLFARVIAAGGSLSISNDDTTNYTALVANSLHSPSRPHGLRLETRSEGPWSRSRVVEIYLTEYTRDVVRPEPVPVATRLRNPHPVVEAFKSNSDTSYVSETSMDRAARVYDSLAKEAERRGYRTQDRETFLRGHRGSLGAGHLIVTAHDHHFSIAVREMSGAGGAKLEYPAKHKQPRWVQNRGYEFVPTGKFELRIDGPGTPFQGQKLRETRHRSLEDILPEVFVTIEVAGREMTRAAEQRQRDLLARQAAWDVAIEKAKEQHRDDQIRKVIAAKADEWKRDQDLRSFLTSLHERMPDMNQESRAAAQIWLSRGQESVQGVAMLDALGPLYYERPKAGELNKYLDNFTETRPT